MSDGHVDIHKDSVPGAIRVAARALIIEDGKLLVMTYQDQHGGWCVTPGGGIRKQETLGEGLRREVHEELGITVRPGDIVYVRELLGRTAKVLHGGITEQTHQLEIFFRCKREGEVVIGHALDNYCTGYEWVPVHELERRNFFPRTLAGRLAADVASGFKPHNNYLGDA
ncbi:MAG: NUDIX domain-containing protein [Planctomycetes bacterium]|nr:NUDIX domain-containing protein [Planctomycetota bacterium]